MRELGGNGERSGCCVSGGGGSGCGKKERSGCGRGRNKEKMEDGGE